MIALRRYLLAGVLIWVPLAITALIIELMVNMIYGLLNHLPPALRPETFFGVQIPGGDLLVAVLVVFAVVLATGMVVANFFGKQLVHWGEQLLGRIPLVRGIYGAVKQVTETLFSSSGKSFRKVVLVRYPHPHSWTLAFLTGEGTAEINSKTGHEIVNVFVPTTPNPTSGFFLMVPRAEMIELDMNVDDGLRMLLSVGVVTPNGKKPGAPARAA